MSSWAEVERDAPDLADRVRRRFAMGTNKTIATLRADGAPRISATELEFSDGEVSLGMMDGSRKLHDVRRDPRVAVHSPTVEPPPLGDPTWLGDAKMAGLLVEVDPPGEPVPLAGWFRLDVREVTLTYVGTPADHLVIETWHRGRGAGRHTRD